MIFEEICGLKEHCKSHVLEQYIQLAVEIAREGREGRKIGILFVVADEANTSAYGNPEITEVNIGVGSNPGILISGHDLKDMEELLKQTQGTGVDVYTHGEMLPAFISPNVLKILVDKFDIKPIGEVEADIEAMMSGK